MIEPEVPRRGSTSDVDHYRLLLEQVIAGNGLAGVLHLLADLLGFPAVVTDDELEPLHAFEPGGRHLTPEEARLAPNVRSGIAFDIARQPQASTAPPTLCRRAGDGKGYIIAPIVLPVGIVGYVWITGPIDLLHAEIASIASHAAAACAMEMLRERASVEGEVRVRNSFLEDLLTGKVTSTNSMRRRARYLGYDLRGDQVVFVVDLDRFSEYIARHDLEERDIQRIKERFRRSLDSSIPAIWRHTLVWEHSDALVVLAPCGRDTRPGAVRERVDALRAKVQERLGGPSVSAGIGRPYADLTRLRDSYQESEHALLVGTSVWGLASTTSFEDLGAYRLLYHLRERPELGTFCEETLGALEVYDERHNGSLLETLACFLDLQGNISHTARALHLHRNGLLYRLSRIEQIAGCDLENPAQRLALQIALLARPLVRRRH